MASKGHRVRANTPAPAPSTNDSQPQVSSSEQRAVPLSPVQQGLQTRVVEKKQLQNLNDRLAHYIDSVRRLEVENRQLTTVNQSIQETSRTEVTSIKSIYEKEISETRKLLDQTSDEKAKLQVELNRVKVENTDLGSR